MTLLIENPVRLLLLIINWFL